MSMYEVCGVSPPIIDIDALRSLSGAYGDTAAGFVSAHGEVDGAVAQVMENNEGLAAFKFYDHVAGSGGILPHLQELAEAALRTKDAYATAANGGESAATAMDAVALKGAGLFRSALISGDIPATRQITADTREKLLSLEAAGVTAILTAFSHLSLPSPFFVSGDDKYGRLDVGVDSLWRDLVAEDPDKAKAVLQKMADDYADAQGIPRVEIEFAAMSLSKFGGRDRDDGSITLNSELLSEPIMLNTVIHEMEHSRQAYGMQERGRDLWPWTDDTDVGGGMTPEEAERWRELDDDYTRHKGPDSYWPRPVEVGARQTGRDFVNNMTYDEFMEYVS